MIFFLLVLLFLGIALGKIGLAALVVVPVAIAAVIGLFSFFAMLGGVEGAGQLFGICALITAAFFGGCYLFGKMQE
ncbi:hypothetical protein [Rhizobium sp. SG2393]|uniref:hypothetical protein n=1 Tax=Rhizobium sp. SG2393 TaxID=3276279 RepID=UPI00366B636C